MSLGGNPFASWSGVLHNESKAFLYEDDVLFNKDKTILIAYRSKETSYIIPKTITCIGELAFYECYSLISVDIPDSVTSIGEAAFEGCRSLTNVDIPDSVTSIESGAFWYCDKLLPQIQFDIIQRFGEEVYYQYSVNSNVIV